jgi:WD40 repeat protein
VIVNHLDAAPPAVMRQVSRLVPDERRRRLAPLAVDAVRQIAHLYLERPSDDLPAQLLLEESEGMPAAIHRVASQWARAAAARQLGASARRTSQERRELRAAEADLIGDVANLEMIRERARLYVEVEGTPDAEVAPPSTVCPYKGLAAFEAADADYYFGRERLIAELIARMVGSAFIGLIGASGSGKSSALQAGLLPALAGGVLPGSDGWIQVPMRPGDHPMRQLKAALRRHLPDHPSRDRNPRRSLDTALEAMAPGQRALLVIDQFEELFTAVTDEVERATFVDFLTEPRAGLKVLVAVRADHYERCAAFPRLARLLGADQVLVGPIAADDIAAIIRHPAERVGLRVEPELVEALVADLGIEPGGLPLLSTALLELWEARDGGRLTLAAYRASGGVRGAVARLAEATFGRLDAAQQLIARAVFLRLAGEGEAGSIVRRRVRLDELDVDENRDIAVTVGNLTAARLLTASDGYVEVAHEALLREWPRLRGWIEEDEAGRQLRLQLMSAARTWDEGGREDGDLYRGARLASVLDWSTEHMVELNATERAFVADSQAASEHETERQRRTNRTLRALLAGAAAFLVVAVGAGIIATVQARDARARELYASSIAVLDQDPELTIHLALEARSLGIEPYPEAMSALHQALAAARTITNVQLEAGAVQPTNLTVALSPDGRRLYVSPDTRSVRIYDIATGTLIETLGTPRDLTEASFSTIALSPDGTRVAVADEDARVHIWTIATGEEATFQVTGTSPDLVVFSPDGRLLATKTFDETGSAFVGVWDVESGTRLREWKFSFMFSLVFHPDGDRLLGTACPCAGDSAVILLDIASGRRTIPVDDVAGITASSPTSAFFNPDASLLATAGQDGKFNLWDAATGDHVREFVGHTDPVFHIAFAPTGDRAATTSVDGTTRVWDVDSGNELFVLAGQGGIPGHAAFSADGLMLATGSSNMTARIWDVGAPTFADVVSHDLSAVLATDDSTSGEARATFRQIRDLVDRGDKIGVLARTCFGFCPGSAVTLGLDSGEVRILPEGQVGAAIGLSSGGRVLWTQHTAALDSVEPGPIYGHDLASGDVIELEGLCERVPELKRCRDPLAQVQGFETTPDGLRVIAVGFSDYALNRSKQFAWLASWSTDDGSLLRLHTQDLAMTRVALSPDGTTLAVSQRDGVVLRDLETFAELGQLKMIEPRRLAFSPDGARLAAVSSDSETTLFDVSSGSILHRLRPAFDVDFNEDGTKLLTADADRVVRLWDIESGRELHAVPDVTGFARLIDDDRHFITTEDGHILIMALEVDELFEIASDRLSRAMTEAECEKYLGQPCDET